jgi:hypothetical protein
VQTLNYSFWGDFVSQLLLIFIFWDLGKPEETRIESLSSSRFSSVMIDEFDDEAELQARIWNRFQRTDRKLENSGALTVSSTSMMLLKSSQINALMSSERSVSHGLINDNPE